MYVLCAACVSSQAGAQADTSATINRPYNVYALRLNYGAVYAHSKFVENTAGAHPRGFDFEYSKQLTDKEKWEYYRCYPRTGLLFSYCNFNTPILGKAFTLAYFIEPNYRIGRNACFFLRAAGGLSYLTNPHDSIKNPVNQSYSLPVNAYLSIGVGLNYSISKNVAVSAMASFQHNSNGGFELPNHGINYPTASLGIKYSLQNNALPVYKKEHIQSYRGSKLNYDAGLYYSPKSGYNMVNGRWVNSRKQLAGGFVQLSKRVSALDAITVMVEAYHDGGLASIKKLLGDNTSNNMVGLMLGHEFIFRRIFFSQQLGYYLYKDTKDFSRLYNQPFPAVYHRWGLRYKLNDHLYAGFNLLVHKQVADFIDVRLQYRF